MSEPVLHVVTPRASPDLDGTACAVAYAELLRARGMGARAWISGAPDPEAAYVVLRLSVALDQVPAPVGSRIVLVDASDVRGLPSPLDPRDVVEVIDHRLHHRATELFPNAAVQIEPVGAAATLIAERFQAAGLAPTVTAAQLLQAAIASNTQALRGSVTTDRDRLAFEALRALAPLAPDLIEQQFHARRLSILADLGAAIAAERKDFDDVEGPYAFSQLELPGARHLVEASLPWVGALGPRALLNLVDVEVATSFLIAPDAGFRTWVERRTGLCFEGNVAECAGVLLRKQIVARLEGHP